MDLKTTRPYQITQNHISRQNPQSHALDICHVYTPKQSHSSTSSLNPKKNPTSPVKRPPSNDNRWRASKRSLHPKAQISLIPFLFKFESTPQASFDSLSKKKKKSHNVKMDGFIHKRRKREPKAKNGVVKLNSELFSGSISVIGRQRVMEDAVKVVHEFVFVAGNPYDFFGVYDGHGGARVASACKERMHALLEKEVEVEEGGGVVVEWEKVMRSCFWKMDEEVRTGGGCGDGGAKVEMVGSTAVVVVVGKEEVVVANCGDSRAVLCRGGVFVPLSRDHKPDRADEMERVETAGGRILNWNGSRVLGVLATSRSIGDHYLRPYVISEPEVTVTERTELDDFLVIASDGLWDVVSNEFACEVVRRCLDGQIKRRISEVSSESTAGDAAAILAELAMSRGSNDNISVIVVELKK